MELGCDARGHSRAGNDTISWYCVILAGRLGPELNKMREVSIFLTFLCSSCNCFLKTYSTHYSFNQLEVGLKINVARKGL
jgi:hypothetical protein